jgi:predicted 3-demethylubiquinone-9 3-methyltransferase (glyoxalase superfamily)
MAIQKITPFLWYDSNAEEAAKFYVSTFGNSRITHVSHYSDSGPTKIDVQALQNAAVG